MDFEDFFLRILLHFFVSYVSPSVELNGPLMGLLIATSCHSESNLATLICVTITNLNMLC